MQILRWTLLAAGLTGYPPSDGDGDGFTANDCDDADPKIHAFADEDCATPGDDDCDGRVNCEDGECAAGAGCAEDCADGLDNDGDGAPDCKDDECLGVGECGAAFRAALLSGEARLSFSYDHQGAGMNPFAVTARMRDVRGVFQSLSADGGVLASCAWRFDEAYFTGGNYHLETHNSLSPTLIAREGFAMDAGCGWEGSSVLSHPRLRFFSMERKESGLLPLYKVHSAADDSDRVYVPWYAGARTHGATWETKSGSQSWGTRGYQLTGASFVWP